MSTLFHGRLVQLVFNFPRLFKGGGKGWGQKSYWFSQLQSPSSWSFCPPFSDGIVGERHFVNLSGLYLEYLEEKSTEFRTGGRKLVLLDVCPSASLFPSLDFGI